MPRKPKYPKHAIVALDPKTKRVIEDPQTYQRVIYAIRFPSKKLKIIKTADTEIYSKGRVVRRIKTPDDTTFYKKDFKSLNRAVQEQGSSFVVYEQPTNRIVRDEQGKKVYSPVSKKPFHELRLTGYSAKKGQRGVLYSRGARKRTLDIGFQPSHKRSRFDSKTGVIVKPGKKEIYELTFSADTIKESISQIVVDVAKKEITKKGRHLIYQYVLIIKDPTGKTVRVIPSGDKASIRRVSLFSLERGEDNKLFADIVKQYIDETKSTFYKGKPQVLAGEVQVLANLYSTLSRSIRMALTEDGYRFTSVTMLDAFINEAMNEEENSNYPKGKAPSDKIAKIAGRKYDSKKLKDIGPYTGYTVTMIIRFEII